MPLSWLAVAPGVVALRGFYCRHYSTRFADWSAYGVQAMRKGAALN